MTDSSSDELPTVEERKENLGQLQLWFQNQQMAITNTELFALQIFDPLQQYCLRTSQLQLPELDEAKCLMDYFYKKACRIILKQNRKGSVGKEQSEKTPQSLIFEDEEIEKNRQILIQVKKKLFCLIRCNIPLPFIINYIRFRKLNSNYKLTLLVDDSLLDCIDWYLLNNQINENLWNQPLPSESKLKEILVQLLQILENQLGVVHQELSEVILKIKKSSLMKQIEKSSNQQQNIDKNTLNSSKILLNLTKSFDSSDAKNYSSKQHYAKNYGVQILSKILLFHCHYFHILVPEILMYTKITGNLEKLKSDKEKSNTIRLKGKITFVRRIYNLPQIKQWCQQNQVIPFQMIKVVPQYLQEHYYFKLRQVREDLNLNNDDFFIESQLKWLIREYSSQRNKLRQIFQDLRFQQSKSQIFELYSDWINQYKGDYDSIQNLSSTRSQKDIMIACYIRHLEILVTQDTKNTQLQQIVKFDFVQSEKKNFFFQQSSYDRSCNISSKCHYLKLFIIDMISLEQAFPFIFEFTNYDDGKLTQITKNIDFYGYFFYCPQVREHFKQKYQYNIQMEEQQNKVAFLYIPFLHIDYYKPMRQIQWGEIILRQLRLIVQYQNFLNEEITYLSNSNKYLTIRSHLFQDRKLFNEHCQLMQEIDQFQNSQEPRKKQKRIL